MHWEDARGNQCLAELSVTEQLQDYQSHLQQALQSSAASSA